MDPLIEPLLQYGVGGIILAMLIVFARSQVLREQQRADALAAEVNRLNTLMQEKTIPALLGATQALATAQTILQSFQYQRDIEAAAAARAKQP